jgi:peptidoglycan/LPS O-acetylase OafA/YrhL
VTAVAEAPGPASGTAAPGVPFGHLPALDGLRGVAVAGVLLFHAGHLRGGFLGVDLFFVLSGFLITSLLLAEWDRTGHIDLRRFWSRRFRRLLPASLLLVVAVAGLAALTMTPVELSVFRGDAVAAVADVANWRAIATGSDYWASSAASSPLRHMWSLSIEEQLYLAWPLLVAGSLVVGRRRRWGRQTLVVVGVAGIGASVAAMAWWSRHGNITRAYYGTDARASAVLLGGLAAVLLSGRPDRTPAGVVRALEAAVPVALVVLGCGWLWADGQALWLYRWGFPLLSLAGAVVVAGLAAGAATAPTGVLSVAPLRWLGRVSYGVYLWHWPIYTVLDADVLANQWARTGARIAVTLVVAALSYHLVEQPVRRGRVRTRQWRVLAPAGAGLAVLAVLAATTNAVAPPRSGAVITHRGGAGATSVLLLGDSEAYTLSLGEAVVGDQVALSVVSFFGCGLGPGLSVTEGYVVTQDANGMRCDQATNRFVAAIRRADPAVVLVHVGAFDIFDRRIDGVDVPFGTAAWDDATLGTPPLPGGRSPRRRDGGVVLLTADHA